MLWVLNSNLMMGPKFFGTSKGHAFLSNTQYKLNAYKIDFEDNLKSFRGPRLAHGLFDVVVYAMLYKKNIKSTGTKRSSKSVGEIEP